MVLFALLLLLLLAILLRLTQMQLVWGRRFEQDYRAPSGGNEILETVRGSIISADGRVLARDVVSYDLSVHYSLLESDGWVATVADLTGEEPDRLRMRAEAIRERVERIWRVVSDSTRMEHLRIVEQEQYHPVVPDVSRDVAVRVNSARDFYTGIKIERRARRESSSGDAFTHIIGHCSKISAGQWEAFFAAGRTWTHGLPVKEIGANYRMDDTLGASGLERYYEHALRGRRGYVTQRIEFHPFRVERLSETRDPEPGSNLHLTLRADFQEALMDVFRRAAQDPHSGFERGAAVILDVATGAVLAAGTWPSYSYEELASDYASILGRPHSPLLYRPAQSALPTGSVYKLITAIAALEEGKVHPGTLIECEGRKRIQNRWFGCLGRHGRIALEEALERSCNVYFYESALRLSGAELAHWGREFGFGSAAGIDWPDEVSGRLETPDSLFARINLSIGQGHFLATPLQVARMSAAIANGGRLVTPHLVRFERHSDGRTTDRRAPHGKEPALSAGTLRAVRAGMVQAVHGGGGTARNAGLRPFLAAGKTGTAELGPGLPNHAWFAGFAPHDAPRIAFAIVSERTSGQGGGHAAPLMGLILEQIWDEVIAAP